MVACSPSDAPREPQNGDDKHRRPYDSAAQRLVSTDVYRVMFIDTDMYILQFTYNISECGPSSVAVGSPRDWDECAPWKSVSKFVRSSALEAQLHYRCGLVGLLEIEFS